MFFIRQTHDVAHAPSLRGAPMFDGWGTLQEQNLTDGEHAVPHPSGFASTATLVIHRSVRRCGYLWRRLDGWGTPPRAMLTVEEQYLTVGARYLTVEEHKI